MKQKENKQRSRRDYAAHGERNQTMMSFRLDNELSEWLSQQTNKGRYINDLIKADMNYHGKDFSKEESTFKSMYKDLLNNLSCTIEKARYELDTMANVNQP